MSLLSSLDEMDVCVKLLADDVWEAEDYKTGFLIGLVDIFNRLYLKELPISFPVVQMSTMKRKKRNEDNWENSTNQNIIFFDESSKYYVWLYPPLYKKLKNRKFSIN